MRNFHYEIRKEINISVDEILLRLKQENLSEEELNDDECLREIIEDTIDVIGNESNSELFNCSDCINDIFEWEYEAIPELIKELRGE